MIKIKPQILINIYVAIVLGFQFGCDTVESSEADNIQINTDKISYVIDSLATGSLLITNNSRKSIYYICSGDVYLEEVKEGLVIQEWKVFGFEECLAARSIKPGDFKEYLFNYVSSPSPFKLPTANYSVSVRYRFRIDYYYDENLETELAIDERYSDEIYILK